MTWTLRPSPANRLMRSVGPPNRARLMAAPWTVCSWGRFRPSQVTTNRSTFDEHTMWHSDEAPTGWVSCDLTFPVTVTLTRIAVDPEHSGQYHRAHHARVLAKLGDDFHKVASRHLPIGRFGVDFPATRAKVWRLELQAGPSRVVVLRGLRFFQGEEEILPRRSS